MKNITKIIFTISTIVMCSTSCSIEDVFPPTPAQLLEGDWKVISFLEEGVITSDYGYTYDGMVEKMSTTFAKFTLEFSSYKNDSADFEWVHIPAGGSVERLEGDITANTAQDELDFDFDANLSGYDEVEFTFYVNEDELILTGDLNGKSVIIRAEKD